MYNKINFILVSKILSIILSIFFEIKLYLLFFATSLGDREQRFKILRKKNYKKNSS